MRWNLLPVRAALRPLCVLGLLAALTGAGQGAEAAEPRCKKHSFDRVLAAKKGGSTFRRVSPCEVVERAELGSGLAVTVRQVRNDLVTEETFEFEDERTPVEPGDPRGLLRRASSLLGRMPAADGAKGSVKWYREELDKAEQGGDREATEWDPAAPLVVLHNETGHLSVSQEAYGSGSKLVVYWSLAY